MAATELVFDKTELGGLRVRYEKVRSINAEDVVEMQAKALLFSMRLELRRRQLANGSNSFDNFEFRLGRVG